MALLAVPGQQRTNVLLPPFAAQQRLSNPQSGSPRDLDHIGEFLLSRGGPGTGDKRRATRLHDQSASGEQGIRKICFPLHAARAPDDDRGETVE